MMNRALRNAPLAAALLLALSACTPSPPASTAAPGRLKQYVPSGKPV